MLFYQYITAIAVLALLVVAAWLLRRYLRQKRLQALYEQPLDPKWLALLNKHVALYRRLPEQYRTLYHGHINYFLHDKTFIGRGGLVVDDRMKLCVAANACLLVLTRRRRIFPGFKTIILYPQSYRAPSLQQRDYTVKQSMERRAGESWYRGPIVLSWQDVEQGSAIDNDARNVVIHEFAHKLDEENQLMDGLPILRKSEHYREWAEVLGDEYSAFLNRVDQGDNRVIDSYGAVSPVEFFAVISETFFEKPQQLQRRLPELYQQLQQYYGVDPANW